MRKTGVWALLAVCALWFVAPLPAGEEQAWFDLDNCGICKNFNAEKGLMDAIKWETHKISNGMLTVSTIDPEYKEAFGRAQVATMKTVEKMQGGESTHLCGFCTSYGALMMSGAQAQEIETEVGKISLITASDEAVVKAIHEHAQHTIDEYETWLAERGS